jgi:hypothetical protein
MKRLFFAALALLATLAICGFTLTHLSDLPGARPEFGQVVEFRQGAILCNLPDRDCNTRVAGSATISRSPKGTWQSGEYIFISREEIGNITIPGDEKLIGYTQRGWVKISQIKFK